VRGAATAAGDDGDGGGARAGTARAALARSREVARGLRTSGFGAFAEALVRRGAGAVAVADDLKASLYVMRLTMQ